MNKSFQEKMRDSRQERVMRQIERRGADWFSLSRNLATRCQKKQAVFNQHFEQESQFDFVHNNFQSHIDTWQNNLRNYGTQRLSIPKIVT